MEIRENTENLLKLFLLHFVVATFVMSMWAATDVWYMLTGLSISVLLTVSAALIAGAVISTLIHEWGHFLGALLSGAKYTSRGKLGFFVFDFDFEQNSVRHFQWMSIGGQLGGVLTILLLYVALPIDHSGRVMLVSAAIGSATFAAMIELPIIRAVRSGGSPIEELAKINKAVLYRSFFTGVIVTFVIWTIAS